MPQILSPTLVLLLALAATATPAIPAPHADLAELNNLLSGIQIVQNGERINMGVTYLIVDMVKCSKLSFGDIQFSTLSNGMETTVHVHTTGLRFECLVDSISTSTPDLKLGTLLVTSEASELTSAMTFKLEQSSLDLFGIHLPKAVGMSACDATLDLNFDLNPQLDDDSFWVDLTEMVLEHLTSYLHDFVSSFVCKEMKSVTAPMLEGIVRTLSDEVHALEQQLIDKSTESHPVVPANTVAVTDNGDMKIVLDVLNQLLASSGIDVNHPSDELVRTVLGALFQSDVHGRVSVPLAQPIKLFSGGDALVDANLTVSSVTVDGLESVHVATLLNPVGDYTLDTQVHVGKLSVHVGIDYSLAQGSRWDHTGSMVPVTGGLELGLNVMDVNVSVPFEFGLDAAQLVTMQLGSLWNHPWACIRDCIALFDVRDFAVSFGEVSTPTFSALNDPPSGLEALFEDIGDTVMTLFSSVMQNALPHVVSETLTTVGRTAIEDFMAQDAPCPAVPATDTTTDFYSFREGTTFQALSKWIQTNVVANVNSMLPSGVLLATDPIQLIHEEKSLFGDIQSTIRNVRISNINTIHNIVLLQLVPETDYELHNSASVGEGDTPLRISLEFELKVSGDTDNPTSDVVQMDLEIEDLTMIIDLIAKIDKMAVARMHAWQLFSFHCWFSAIHGGIQDLELAVNSIRLNFDCLECDSDVFLEMDERSKKDATSIDLSENINNWMKDMLNDIASPFRLGSFDNYMKESCASQVGIFNGDGATTSTNTFLRLQDSATDAESQLTLPGDSTVNSLGVIAAFGVSLILSCVFACCLHSRQKRQREMFDQLMQNGDPEAEEMYGSSYRSISLSTISDRVSTQSPGLWHHPTVPMFVRVFVPLSLLANLGMFVVGHLMVGAAVNVHLEIAGQVKSIPHVATFSLGESLKGMWDAKAYPLAVLLALLSGVWPYTKLLVLGYSWFAPATWMDSKARAKTLTYLDMLGKWSMIDAFVLVFCVVAFDIDIVNPGLALLPSNFYYISIRIIPQLGLIAFTVAAMMSLLTNNICIVYSRRAMEHDSELDAAEILWAAAEQQQSNDNSILPGHGPAAQLEPIDQPERTHQVQLRVDTSTHFENKPPTKKKKHHRFSPKRLSPKRLLHMPFKRSHKRHYERTPDSNLEDHQEDHGNDEVALFQPNIEADGPPVDSNTSSKSSLRGTEPLSGDESDAAEDGVDPESPIGARRFSDVAVERLRSITAIMNEKAPQIVGKISLGEDCEDRSSVMNETFHIPEISPTHSSLHSFKLRRSTKLAVALLLLGSGALLLWGSLLTVFTFRTNGLVGVALDFDTESASPKSVASYSMFSFYDKIIDTSIESPNVVLHPNNTDVDEEILAPNRTRVPVYYMLAIVFITTAVVIPCLQLVSLVVLWCLPMSLRRQSMLLHFNEALGAWACAEVFLVSLIVATLELSQVAVFLVGSVCTQIQPLINMYLVPLGFLKLKNASCLSVSAELEFGCVVLLAGAIAANFTSQLVMNLGESVVLIRKRKFMGLKRVTTTTSMEFTGCCGPMYRCLFRLMFKRV